VIFKIMRPLTAVIDLGALRHNLNVVRRHAPHSRVLAVVKANAYGHGLERAWQALADADGFALLELDAAVRLRESGFQGRIVLLEGFFTPDELPLLAQHRIAPVIHREEQIAALAAWRGKVKLDVLLKVNSGMNRLGFQPAAFPRALSALREHPAVDSITIMSHFANADDARGVDWQLRVLDPIVKAGGCPASLANSAAILRYPQTHRDWVRPGIMLYGCSPFAESVGTDIGLAPAMTLKSEIIALRDLAPGDTVGYGGMFTADRAMRIGVVACGYADGYPRHAPNGTPVMVDGKLTGTVGRVSMDMLCVDLGPVPAARVGSPVVLWGEGNPVERVAIAAGTISYELVCALAPRVRVEVRAT
jgi:alanine racemase